MRSILWAATLGMIALFGFIATYRITVHAQGLDQEYILVLNRDSKEIGIVEAGLTRAEAEGVAFQMNEAFVQYSVPVRIRARKQIDIGNYHPKSGSGSVSNKSGGRTP